MLYCSNCGHKLTGYYDYDRYYDKRRIVRVAYNSEKFKLENFFGKNIHLLYTETLGIEFPVELKGDPRDYSDSIEPNFDKIDFVYEPDFEEISYWKVEDNGKVREITDDEFDEVYDRSREVYDKAYDWICNEADEADANDWEFLT